MKEEKEMRAQGFLRRGWGCSKRARSHRHAAVLANFPKAIKLEEYL